MPPVIFRFLNDNPAFQTIRQGKNASEVKGILTETATEISTRHWRRGCFASGYLASDYRRLNTSFFIKEIRQALDNYRQQLKNARDRIHPQDNASGLMKGFIRGIGLLVSQPSPPEKVLKAGNQSARLPANILANTRSAMKKAGYHPDEEGMCYGLAWTALLACVRQDGQAYMQRMQYLAQMHNPPLPGVGDTHQVYPFFDAVTLSVTNYKNMSGYEKGIGYPGRQEVAFPGRIIGGHKPDYQVPVVKQTFIAECTPETFIRFLQHTRKNNKGIPFGVMIHYPGHATSIGFDGNKWLATNHDSHYYTETTEQLYSFLDEQSDYYKNGKIIAAMEVVSGNDFSLKITRDALVINAKKSVSAPLALHMALRYGDVNVTTDCITAIIQQAHSPEILLERLVCKDARGTPGLYMALQKGQSDAITAFMQASTAVVAALSLPEAQKAELLYRLFSSKNACLHPCAQRHPQENTGDRNTSRKRLSPEQADVEAKRSKANAQTRPQETTGNSIPSRKRTPPEQKDSKAKRNKRSATVEGKQGDNLQGGTTAQGSRIENTETEGQITIDVSAGLEVLKSYFPSGMNDKESEAAKKLFQVLNSKKIKIKETFHKLLANKMDRKDLSSFCAKASVFFGALSENIKDTGCLTSMLGNKKKNIRDFIAREDAELEYLAGLDTFRCFSSMNNGKGLPEKEAVKEMLDWEVWKPKGMFNLELFHAFSSMNNGKGLPEKEAVEAMLNWDVWKLDGAFSMELFRAFSSMNHGKGLPKKKEVEAFLAWDVWKLEGVFSMELFRAFSSMNSSKGLPKKETVEEMLDWKVWKPEGVFNMELFRIFSSMNHGKGLPKKEEVEAFLDWDVWKPGGVFNLELFRAFSSMNNGKGLPKKEEVKAVLDWELWKPKGVFSMELFRSFSSMNNCKGLPKKEEVEAVLGWELWKQEGVFNMELFRAFSSMNSGKGLPKKEAVKAVLGWELWKQEGVFNMELFRAFSSINHSKGLPKKEAVKALLDWELWKPKGVFSMELFRAFSSINHGKGLPKKEAVKAVLDWELWKPEGVFSMELFRAFSSMNSGKCLPKKEEVESVLDWDIWKPKGVFSMELFRAFSSMNHCKGLPKKEAVEAVLDWDIWKPKGVFSMELFRAFSSMNHGNGLPKKEAVEEMLGWLKCEEEPDGLLFQLISRLYASEGIPDIKKLKQYEQKLLNLFFVDSVIGPGNNNKDKQRRLIQSVVLFLSTRKPQYVLNFKDVEHFYQQVAGTPDSKLEKLLKLLISYGGKSVSRYLTLNNDHREALIELSLLQAPLPLTMQAVTDFSPQERKLYLFFTRNLKAPPDKDQWSDLGLQLRRLASVLKTPNNQRRYLEIIWHLAPSDRNTFLDEARVECIIAVFPSLSALEKLAKSYSQSGLKALFKACEQFIHKNPSRENIERLFAALLETRLFLYVDDDIPDHFLSEYTAVEGSATFIAVTPETGTAEKLALYFVASVTRVLSRMFYYREANRLKIRLCEGQIESFQIPALEIQDKGIKISNWPVAVFLHFLAVTDFPISCYFLQEDWQQYCNPTPPLSLQDKVNTPTYPPPVNMEETPSTEEQFQRLWENLSWKAVLEDVDLQLLTGYEQYMTIGHIVEFLEKVHTSVEPHKLDKLKQLLDEKRTLCLIEDLFPALSDKIINYLMETEISWIPE